MRSQMTWIILCGTLAGCGRSSLDEGVGSDALVDVAFDGSQDAPLGAGPESSLEAAAALLPAPRPIAPLSTSRVTSRRPTLRWVLPMLPVGIADATVDLCRDRSCTEPIAAPALVKGTSYVPPDDLPVGVVYWRVHPSTETRVSSPTWQFTVGARSTPVDTSSGTTLDVNGDGYADVAVGGSNSSSIGAVYLYLGSANGPATEPATVLNDPGYQGNVVMGDFFGSAVASAGDVNGDGYADLVVGAPGTSPVEQMGPNEWSGMAYVYLGSETGLATVPAIALSPGKINQELGEIDQFGISVASAGDVNGDGYADVLVGLNGAGVACLYLGSATGLAAVPAILLNDPAYNSADPGNNTATGFGGAVASAGDVNGDGYADIIVGAETGSRFKGNAYIFLGRAAGVATSPATTLTGPDDAGIMGIFGSSVATAGDVNGDGYSDVVVGAIGSYVYLGSARGLATEPAVVLDDPKPARAIDDSFGMSVACAGDVNGDGYADLVIGASGTSSSTGRAYVYLGSASGIVNAPGITLNDPDHIAGDDFGVFVASAGDMNGDSYADLVVSATDGPRNGLGNAYVFLGGATKLAAAPITLNGPPDAGFGTSVCGATN